MEFIRTKKQVKTYTMHVYSLEIQLENGDITSREYRLHDHYELDIYLSATLFENDIHLSYYVENEEGYRIHKKAKPIGYKVLSKVTETVPYANI